MVESGAGRVRGTRRETRPDPDVDLTGPRVRLGILWAAILVSAVFAGGGWLAVVLAPVAAAAGLQAGRAWRRFDVAAVADVRRPIEGMAALGAAALVIGATGGFVGLAVSAMIVVAAALTLDRVVAARHRGGQVVIERSLSRTLLIAGVIGLGAAAPVLLRVRSSHGAVVTLALCTYALVYDASAFLIGSDAGHAWEGPLAGLASIGAVTIAVAAILVPPFRGATPWVLGVIAAVTTPLGPLLTRLLVADDRELRQAGSRLPAVRRLDSMLVLAPVWALLALALVG